MRTLLARSLLPTLVLALLSGLHPSGASTTAAPDDQLWAHAYAPAGAPASVQRPDHLVREYAYDAFGRPSEELRKRDAAVVRRTTTVWSGLGATRTVHDVVGGDPLLRMVLEGGGPAEVEPGASPGDEVEAGGRRTIRDNSSADQRRDRRRWACTAKRRGRADTLAHRDARGRPVSATHVPLDEATVPMPGIRSRVFTYDDRDNPLGVAETFDVGPQRDYAYTYHPSGELASAVEDGVTALYGRTTAPAPGAPDEHLVETVTLDQVATTRTYDRLGRLVDVNRGGESWQLAWHPTGMLHSITGGGLVETRTYQPDALQRLATLRSFTAESGPSGVPGCAPRPRREAEAILRVLRALRNAGIGVQNGATRRGGFRGEAPHVADAGGGDPHYDASYVWRLGSVVDPLPEGDPAQPAATLSVTTGDGVTDYWFDQQWRLEQVVYPEADGERRLHHYTLAGDGTRLMETVWRTWDDAGNPAIEQVERFRHEYDAAGRLDAVRRDVWAAGAWAEDSPGLDADDNPLPRLDVAFDPLGRMRTWVEDGQTRTFTWDAESRMVQATLGAGAPGGGETWNYAYNWRDQRTLREGGALGAEWAYAYRWGADGLLTEQVTAPGGAVTDRAFVQGAGLTLGVVSGAGVTAFGHDHLGSPVVTRAPGGAVDTRRFGAWGALASGDAPAHGEVQVGYTGHGFDPESGLVYAQARYYATGLGVFLSEDPFEGSLGEPLSLGRWGYVHGNPVELVDPDGREVRGSIEGLYQHPWTRELRGITRGFAGRAADMVSAAAGAAVCGVRITRATVRGHWDAQALNCREDAATVGRHLGRAIQSEVAVIRAGKSGAAYLENVAGRVWDHVVERASDAQQLRDQGRYEEAGERFGEAAFDFVGVPAGAAGSFLKRLLPEHLRVRLPEWPGRHRPGGGLEPVPVGAGYAPSVRHVDGVAPDGGDVLQMKSNDGLGVPESRGGGGGTPKGGTQLNLPLPGQQVHPRLPAYSGGKTSGILDIGGQETALISGYKGPSAALPKGTPGMHNVVRSHVEAHAAAVMRQTGARDATLFINQTPCAGTRGCGAMLPRMLPEGGTLRVVGPDGYDQVFVGLPD